MASENSIHKKGETNRGDRPTDHKRSEPKPQIPPTSFPAKSDVPPAPTHQKAACDKKRDCFDYIKFVVEIIGVVVLVAYTTFAYLQWDVAHKTYIAVNRPYVGTNGISISYYSSDGSEPSKQPTKETKALSYTVEVKNFSPVTGSSFRSNQRAFMGGAEMPVTGVPDMPSTIFPGKSFYLTGSIGAPYYQPVMSGDKVFVLEITTEYDGPSGHYAYCEKNQFSPTHNAFMNLGQSCTK